jgi:hypothetical protein
MIRKSARLRCCHYRSNPETAAGAERRLRFYNKVQSAGGDRRSCGLNWPPRSLALNRLRRQPTCALSPFRVAIPAKLSYSGSNEVEAGLTQD